jgi:hypothetical protein
MGGEFVSHVLVFLPRITYNQGQSPSALGVDEEQCRDCRHDLDSTVPEGGVQGLNWGITNILEDS